MLKAIKHFIEQSWLLLVSSFIFGLLIAVANAGWQERIVQNKIDKLNKLMGMLITDANAFDLAIEDAEIDLGKGKTTDSEVFRATDEQGNCIGYCFNAQGPGFADKIELVIAVDKNFEKLSGYSVLASNETPGFGDQIQFDYYRNQFNGAPAGELELSKTGDAAKIDSQIIAISGATVSSEAVIKIFNNYLSQIREALKEKGLIDNGR